jgi:hypothetical protein
MPRKRCSKVQYDSLADARRAILRMSRQYAGVVYKKAYRCAACKAWHVTGTPPPRGRRIQR